MRTKIDGHFNTELPIKKIRSTRVHTYLKTMYLHNKTFITVQSQFSDTFGLRKNCH